MVTIPTVGEGPTTSGKHSALRRVLKRADYATAEMQAAEGPEYHEEVMIIRRIEASTIFSEKYPRSIWRRESLDREALASWENEGGAPARMAEHSDP